MTSCYAIQTAIAPSPIMMSGLRQAHRWLGLACAALWAAQALTGIILVFGRPLDDRFLPATNGRANPVAIDRAIAQAGRSHPGWRVVEYLSSGGGTGQIDLLLKDPRGRTWAMRLDGASGAVLRQSAWNGPPGRLGPMRAVLLFHKQLWSGDLGRILIGASGLALTGHILVGVRLAWPARGRWRGVLTLGREKIAAMGALRWHRAVALWLTPLALATSVTGAAMSWSADLRAALGLADERPRATLSAADRGPIVAPSVATRAALRRFPDASVADVVMPAPGRPWYLVRLRRPGEWRRVFGSTQVYLDSRTADLLKASDALAAPARAKLLDALYPVHTGEWAGLPGRLAVLAVGVWLAATVWLGVGLWRERVRLRRGRPGRRGAVGQPSARSLSE